MSYNISDVIEQVKSGQAVFVDVREEEEWQMGYIDGALLVSLSQLKKGHYELPSDKPLYLYCRSGNRSYIAKDLIQASYPKTVALDEGFLDLENLNLKVSYL